MLPMDEELRMGESEGGDGGQGATYAGISLVSSLGNKETEVVRKEGGGRWWVAESIGGRGGGGPLGLPLLATKLRVAVEGLGILPSTARTDRT